MSTDPLGRYQGRSQGGAKGAFAPPFFSRKCDTCSLYYDQLFAKQITSYFSQRSVVNIDSNDLDEAGYKADILSTYFHDDRSGLNASEVGQSSICERLERARPFN